MVTNAKKVEMRFMFIITQYLLKSKESIGKSITLLIFAPKLLNLLKLIN